jgi:hypothetical protein
MTKSILAFGDSLTWGADAVTLGRHAAVGFRERARRAYVPYVGSMDEGDWLLW